MLMNAHLAMFTLTPIERAVFHVNVLGQRATRSVVTWTVLTLPWPLGCCLGMLIKLVGVNWVVCCLHIVSFSAHLFSLWLRDELGD